MKKTLKKGFTIVELVIVIAVVAILAAVLIPTFVNVVNKANESADIQACRQMNTHLATSKVLDGVDDISDVITALNKENIDLDNYKPLTSGRMYYWYKTENRVLYVDENNSVIFPEEYKSLNLAEEKGTLFSLNGGIKMQDYTIEEEAGTKTVEITSGGQLASFINNRNLNNGDAKAVTKISLANDIDLAGATYKFNKFDSNIEIDGNNHTIYSFRNDSNSIFGSGEFTGKGYGYGLFSSIEKGITVTLKNLTLSGMSVEDTLEDNGTMGLLAGYVYGTLNVENVTIKDSKVAGFQKIGGLVGQMHGELNIDGLKMENVTVTGACEVAKIAAVICNDAVKATFKNVDVSSVTVQTAGRYNYDSYFADATELNPSDIGETGKLYYLKGTTVWCILTDDYYFCATDKRMTYNNKVIEFSWISGNADIIR